MTIAEQLQNLGLSIPDAPAPLASYVPAVRTGNLVFTSGQLPIVDGRLQSRGQVGGEVTEEEAYAAARTAVLNALGAVKSVIHDLEKVRQVVKVTGYVNSAPAFTNQPSVVNGASDLLVQLFGDAGRHARAAVGMYGLPRGASVEIDMIVEVVD